MDCSPEDVFAVLEDGWSYGMWVVGAARIRDVDADWPEAGSRIHHSVGAWPMLLSDNTEVEQVDRPRMLQLRVKAWPTGEGRVVLTMRPADGGGTEVVMEESAVSGPATLIPKPAEDFLLHHRNVEALRRLGYLAEHRARSGD
jgi:hypothetical protein